MEIEFLQVSFFFCFAFTFNLSCELKQRKLISK